jgi:hypothetical protein
VIGFDPSLLRPGGSDSLGCPVGVFDVAVGVAGHGGDDMTPNDLTIRTPDPSNQHEQNTHLAPTTSTTGSRPGDFATVHCRRCRLTLRQSFAATERQIAQLPTTTEADQHPA